MKKFKKILIAGTSTFTVKNLGDEAMLLSLLQSIRRYDKKIKIVLLCRHPSKKIDKLYNIKTIKNLEFDNREKSIGNFFYGFNESSNSKHLEQIKKQFNTADAIILAGNIFMELAPNKFLRGLSSYGALLGTFARLFNLKIYIACLNVLKKPEEELVKDQIKFFSKTCEKALVREKNSLKNLLSVNFNKKKLIISGDPAYGISIKKNILYVKKFLKNKIKDKNFIGVCIRLEYWKYNEKKNKKSNKLIDVNFFKKHAKVLSSLSKRTGRQLLFVPNAFYYYGWQDDRLTHNEIVKYLDKGIKYQIIKKELNVFEAADIVSRAEFHYTNRRHSAVFAFLNYKSVAVINTNLKGHLDPLVNDLNIPENLINFNLKTNLIINKIQKLWDKRAITSKKITSKVNFLKKDAKNQFKKLISNNY